VVRNAAHSDSFALFESSEVRAQLKDKLGGREIAMTRMQDWLVEALNAENLTITAATSIPRSACSTGNAFKRGSGSSTPKSNPSPNCSCPPSNPMPTNEQPDFDEEFDQGRCRVAR
jgi:hypothetical protein